jgi:DNA polymerase-1
VRQIDSGCYIVESERDADELRGVFQQWPGRVGVDVETYPLDPKRKTPDARVDPMAGFGVSLYPDESEILDPMTFYGATSDHYLAAVKQPLSERDWYAHNAMFDGTVLRRYGIRLGRHAGDPRIIAYLLGEPEAGLKPLLQQYLGVEIIEYLDILAQWNAADIRGVPLDEQARYCGSQDSELVVALEECMRAEVPSERILDVYTQVELPMVNILIDMHEKGIRFDREAAQPLLEQAVRTKDGLDTAIAMMVEQAGFVQWERRGGKLWYPTCKGCRNGAKKRLTCEVCGGAGKLDPVKQPFNAGSFIQLRALLYDHFGLPMKRYAAGVQDWMIDAGKVMPDEVQGATDELALLQLQERHPVIPMILKRKKQKKDEEFLTVWMKFSEDDGRLHTQFTNTTVVSGRLSSVGPNLTQVTQRQRNLFLPDDDCDVVAGDMSQLELVIAAYMSRDPVMMEAINRGWDLHRITAGEIYGIADWQSIGKDDPRRAIAKVANYLSGYGGKWRKLIEGIEKLALQRPELNLTVPDEQEARRILNVHKKKYARYWEWVSWTIIRTREQGYSETAFGRPRFFEDIDSPLDDKRTEAERAAVNHCIQGTAADLMKMAMGNIARDELMSSWGYMVLQVHDEIVSIVKREHVEEYKARLRVHMELKQPFAPFVSLVVDVLSGPNWRETHK